MRGFSFTKMQGLGNDFVLVEGPIFFTAEEVQEICDRRFGIGADGVLVVTQGDPISMAYWNADGSPAEMCGNGLRCVARYAYDKGWAVDRSFIVATPVGERRVRLLDGEVEAEIGPVVLGGVRSIEGTDYELVDVGNPHAVAWVDDPEEVDVMARGQVVQLAFEKGANVEYVTARDGTIVMRVWERGVGETTACGTGMVAAAAVAMKRLAWEGPVPVTVRGGAGSVEIRDGKAWLRGPAEYSFRGSVGER